MKAEDGIFSYLYKIWTAEYTTSCKLASSSSSGHSILKGIKVTTKLQ